MKKPLPIFATVLFITIWALGCSKNSNNYTTTDNTVGMTGARTWSGTSNGYYEGDTIISSRDTVWALHFARVLTDTSISVQKINGYSVSMLGFPLNWVSTDSITTKTVLFDSIVTSTQTAILTFYYLRDSMTYKLNTVTGFNSSANQYYQVNEFLHTN